MADLNSKLQTKQCSVCGDEMSRRDGEQGSDWARRKTCSPECRGKAISAGWNTVAERKATGYSRVCEVCGVTFYPEPGQSIGKFNMRQTCSKECRYKLVKNKNTVDLGAKTCANCGEQFTRRQPPQFEPAEQFLARVYCSHKCKGQASSAKAFTKRQPKFCVECGVEFERRSDAAAANFAYRRTCSRECADRQTTIHRSLKVSYKTYPPEWRVIRMAVLKRDGHRCRVCGELGAHGRNGRKGLHVHHINYKKTDLASTNLISLCVICHVKTNANRDDWQRFFEAMMLEQELVATG